MHAVCFVSLKLEPVDRFHCHFHNELIEINKALLFFVSEVNLWDVMYADQAHGHIGLSCLPKAVPPTTNPLPDPEVIVMMWCTWNDSASLWAAAHILIFLKQWPVWVGLLSFESLIGVELLSNRLCYHPSGAFGLWLCREGSLRRFLGGSKLPFSWWLDLAGRGLALCIWSEMLILDEIKSSKLV